MAAVPGGDLLLPRLPAPNARAIGWATPRDAGARAPSDAEPDGDAQSAEEEDAPEGQSQRADGRRDDGAALPVANALETLELLLWESEAANEGAQRRLALLGGLQQQRAAEEQRREQARLASVEHMADTIRLLSDELERARLGHRAGSSAGCGAAGGSTGGVTLPPVTPASRRPHGAKKPRHDGHCDGRCDEDFRLDSDLGDERGGDMDRGQKATLSLRLHDSPLRARRQKPLLGADTGTPTSLRTDLLAKRAEQRLATRLGATPTASPLSSPSLQPSSSVVASSSFDLSSASPMQPLDCISSREEKLRALALERDHWQREYAQMRDKVVEEKTRQVALFRRLDDARRDHLAQAGALETALRGAHTEVEMLQARLAQARAAAGQLQQRAEDIARRAWEEKQTLVCSIAETRHKFKEWKEGEASTLKAARDQAVHNLKTEYELKIARHHEEKQKLRDKVKDLEVSLRLLQRDRHMSAVELSQRKSTILGKDVSASSAPAVLSAATAEAELIEAQSRIKELEALLEYAKEYQKRQENIIRVSEAAITRLMQERDVVALENLAFEPVAAMLPSLRGAAASPSATNSLYGDHPTGAGGEYAGYALRKPAKARRSSVVSMGLQSKASSSSPIATSPVVASGAVESLLGRAPSSLTQTASAAASKSPDAASTDQEKEILRRQSVVLTAELEKYRQLVVHSMDEIRSLKDQRRRSHQSLVATTNGAMGVTTVKEQYLMGELFKAQAELAELKRWMTAKKRGESGKGHGNRKGSAFFDENDEAADGPVVDASAREGAIEVLQKQGKTFLARRSFIKKKLAIEKIKARYRGYLVRKNLEMLGCNAAPPRALRAGGQPSTNSVSEAAQYKMRVVGPHHETVCDCQGHVFKVVIRVSKDPSLVQMQILPSTQNASQRQLLSPDWVPEESHAVSFSRTATRVAYFHLFEVIAALPYEEETLILEHTSEREIAAIVASVLRIVRVSGEYKFVMDRKSDRQGGGGYAGFAPLGFGFSSASPQPGTLLAELPVDTVLPPLKATLLSTGGGYSEGEDEDEGDAPGESRDLDCLIRDARLMPEEDALVSDPAAAASALLDESPRGLAGPTAAGNGSGEFLTPRQMRRLSMSSLGVILER